MNPVGKVALVTGGAGGLGLAIVKELLENQVKGVSVCDVNEKVGKTSVQQLQQEFGKERTIFLKTDVTKEDEFEDAFQETVKNFGTLDIVVNNAGISNDKIWRKEIDINVTSIVHGNLLALKYMGRDQSGEGGAVVNVSSVAGVGKPCTALPVYAATKHAVLGFTRNIGG